MNHYRYDDAEDHAAEHRQLIGQVLKLKQKLDGGPVGLSLDSMQPLRNWADRHIRRYDQLAARHIRQNEMAGLSA